MKTLPKSIRCTVQRFHCRGGSIFLEGGVCTAVSNPLLAELLALKTARDITRHLSRIVQTQNTIIT